MGIGGRNKRDRVRTIWTPEMDRYFLDLMLEQVSKGNKIDDHLFTKNAWMDMDAMFTAKFRVQNENDVLKNRHKTLRTLYRFVKNLIDQRGFSWDEARQMVTADNSVWNEYIKEHPEARSFRIKTIPYYNDLCLIFTETDSGQKGCDFGSDRNLMSSLEIEHLDDVNPFSLSVINNFQAKPSSYSAGNKLTMCAVANGRAMVEALPENLIDEEYESSICEKNVDNIAPITINDLPCSVVSQRRRTYWQPPMDRYFIELMVDEVQKGNQVDGLFSRDAWMEMIVLFNTKFGFSFDVEILKNRYKTMRRQYNAIQSLLELDGFFWDESRQMVTADDYVWQDYIKAHTDARQYMTRPIPYYKDLLMICRDVGLGGRNSFCSQNVEIEETPKLKKSQSVGASEEDEDSYDMGLETQRKRRGLEGGGGEEEEEDVALRRSKKATKKDESMASAIREMTMVVSSLASDNKKKDGSCFSVEHVVGAVQGLADMDDELVLDACELLEEEKKAKMFLALDVKLRKKWLMRKLRPCNA